MVLVTRPLMNRYGQKISPGWCDYKPGDRRAYPSQVVNDMIVQHSADIDVELVSMCGDLLPGCA